MGGFPPLLVVPSAKVALQLIPQILAEVALPRVVPRGASDFAFSSSFFLGDQTKPEQRKTTEVGRRPPFLWMVVCFPLQLRFVVHVGQIPPKSVQALLEGLSKLGKQVTNFPWERTPALVKLWALFL